MPPEKVQPVNIGDEDELDIPAPTVVVVLLEKRQLVITGDEDEVLKMPPPPPSRPELPEKLQPLIVGDEEVLQIPPPPLPEFPENVQFEIVGEELELYIPAPEPVVVLFEKVQSVTMGDEE